VHESAVEVENDGLHARIDSGATVLLQGTRIVNRSSTGRPFARRTNRVRTAPL
jgi:hypothetical protein